MSLNLDKTAWKRVRLGDVIRRSRTQADPANGDVDRYVGGGHIDSDNLTIERFGDVNDGQMGSTFTYLFQPGQILFVSARPYLRKSGVANFSGVVADKTYVLDAIPESGLLQKFLPLVLASDHFIAYATAEATGSMNPRLLWGQMQRYEFDLPSLDEQQRLADLLWALERHREALIKELWSISIARDRVIEAGLPQKTAMVPLSSAASVGSGVTLGPARRELPTTAPYLRVANVQRGSLDLSEIKEVGATEAEVSKKGVLRGDVLVVEGHASVEQIGRAAIWESDESPLFQNHLFRVRAADSFRPRYLLEWINSAAGRSYVRTVAKSTSGLNTINSTVLKAMPVPASPLSVQDALLEQLTVVDLSRKQVSDAESSLLRVRATLAEEIFGGAE